MHFDHMVLEKDPQKQRATLYLDYPEKMNIVSMTARDQIREIFTELEEDHEVRVVVIRGRGEKAFSSGGDIGGFLKKHPEHLSRLHDNIEAPERCSKPVIAAVQGYCFGVGFELALACDYILATPTSTFSLPEIKLGMIPGSGGSQRLSRIVGINRAKWMLFTGRRITGAQAEQWGIVSQLVDPQEFDQTIDGLCEELCALSPVALHVLKRVMNKGLDASLRTSMEIEGMAYGMLRGTNDFAEGVHAFLDKRKPNFQGK